MVLEMSAFSAISLELAYKEFKDKYVRECGPKIDAFLAKTTSASTAQITDAAALEEEKKEVAAP